MCGLESCPKQPPVCAAQDVQRWGGSVQGFLCVWPERSCFIQPSSAHLANVHSLTPTRDCLEWRYKSLADLLSKTGPEDCSQPPSLGSVAASLSKRGCQIECQGKKQLALVSMLGQITGFLWASVFLPSNEHIGPCDISDFLERFYLSKAV